MGGQRIDNLLGVMQGRLLPKYKGFYQAHPVGYWQDEFKLAAQLGLDCIEFILDYNDYDNNPLMSRQGREQIYSITENIGVHVCSVCADYFMVAPLHTDNKQITTQSTKVLINLLNAASDLGIKDVVIPCVDQSSIQHEGLRDRFTDVLLTIVPEAEQCNVNLSLETDLEPIQFEKLLTTLDSPRVTVNYDTGNSAALGYDYKDELSAYGDRISDVHIKDRVLGGGPVILGTGNADIPGFFETLRSYNYRGPLIMQAYRDDEGISVFQDQLNWLRKNVLSLWPAV